MNFTESSSCLQNVRDISVVKVDRLVTMKLLYIQTRTEALPCLSVCLSVCMYVLHAYCIG